MRKQNAVLFIPLIPATAIAISTTTLPSQRSSERLFLKNFKGNESVATKSSTPEKNNLEFESQHIDTGFHGTLLN